MNTKITAPIAATVLPTAFTVTSPAATASIAALEDVRARTHALLDLLTRDSATLKSIGSKRTLMGIAAHLVDSIEMMYPMFIDHAKAGKKLAMPAIFATAFGDWVSYIMSQQRAKKETLQSLHAAYDTAHNKLIAKINALAPADFALCTGLPAPRNESVSIENFLRIEVLEHLHVHAREIEDTLAR